MSVSISLTGLAGAEDAERLQKQPEFRKATLNMLLAYSATKKVMNLGAPFNLSRTGLILGSSYGELGVTKDFLMTFATSKVARPFLFQNSLHNATLGFISLQFGITGPSATVSTRYFTGEDALELGVTWIECGMANQVFVIGVDSYPDDLLDVAKCLLPDNCTPGGGAACLLLDSRQGPRRIHSVDRKKSAKQVPSGPYYESDFLEKLIRHEGNAPLECFKPDGSSSLIQFL